MDNPTILYEAAKLHHGEIRKEMASWRLSNQAKTARPGLLNRFVVTIIKSLLKKMVIRKKQVTLAQDEHWILSDNSKNL